MKKSSLALKIAGSALISISVFMSGCHPGQPAVKDYPISPVPFTDVEVNDNFWAKRILINHRVTIPIAFRKAEETGRIANFMIAGQLKEGKFSSLYPFDDSDVYKNIEAASYSLQLFPDLQLESYLDTLIGYIEAAQESDGYLYTNRTIDPANTHEMAGKERWVNEEAHSHELYNAGHLYEAAVAHYQATGKKTLLNVAIKNANLIDSLFGWGKIEKAPGHQEIEIGLVKLYRVTGARKYLDLAKFFLDARGPGKDDYNQMHLKAVDQKNAVGHAVRAQYMYAAMADIAALTGEKEYLKAIDTIWSDVVTGKTYITGGIGAVRDIEGFGKPYDLPNEQAYCETCALIANTFWNYRMFLLHGESKYFDIFEKVLYNGLLSGVSLSGDLFFYPNPLASSGQYQRKEWFGCACCPVNITRFLPSLPGYIYAVREADLYINLFIGNEAEIRVKNQLVHITQLTGYPWEGGLRIKISTGKPLKFNMMVRIPGWARNEAFPTNLYYFTDQSAQDPEYFLNRIKISYTEKNGYASIERVWQDGDVLEVQYPMIVRKVKASELVSADKNKVAFQRGPIMFCIESTDQQHADFFDLVVHQKTIPEYMYSTETLGGTGILTGPFTAIPYYSWANRDEGYMMVWIRETGKGE